MDKQLTKEILYEWNPWWAGGYKFNGINRNKLREVLPWLKRKEIIAILGVRRAGKTTFFYEIIDNLIKNEKVNPKKILFVKADDDRIDTENIIDNAISEYKKWIAPEQKIFLFIDEIQEIKEWQKILKRIYDLKEDVKIFISGSNSSMLKEELSALLSGRFAYFEIFPFSFDEFLKAKGMENIGELTLIKERDKIRNYFVEYVSKGGFPEIVLEKKDELKDELARFYFDSIFYRDIIKRKNLRNPTKIEKLVKYFLQNISNLASFSKISKLLELTTDSITAYVKALEDAYLIFSINLFEFSYKKQIINPKKIYCVDTGMRNIVGFNFSADYGRLYENIVFLKLRRNYNEVYYWKGKTECDFIVKDKNELKLIQVSSNLSNEATKEKEVSALLEAMENFKLEKGLIISEEYEAEETFKGKKVKFVPIWKWLLETGYFK